MQELTYSKVLRNRAIKIAAAVIKAASDNPECALVAHAEHPLIGYRTQAFHNLMDVARWDCAQACQRLTIFDVGKHRKFVEQEMNASLQDSGVAA